MLQLFFLNKTTKPKKGTKLHKTQRCRGTGNVRDGEMTFVCGCISQFGPSQPPHPDADMVLLAMLLLLHPGCKCCLFNLLPKPSSIWAFWSIDTTFISLCLDSDALISVTTVKLGDPATFPCLFSDTQYSNTRVKWYKQSPGDTLTLIATLMKATLNPTFEEGFRSSRFSVTHSETESSLTISDTVQADEAVYHCAVTTWSSDQWSGSYLGFRGNTSYT